MAKCEHIIGFNYDYENSDLLTLEDLKRHIKDNRQRYMWSLCQQIYELSDYCDKRKSTDICRFNYCPMCGEKIDWKAIKRSEQK
jgi:hypothetical protein